MKILICTQIVDSEDPALGFFHRWIEEFAKYCELVTVICLKEGTHTLPDNVRVLSLGKEGGVSRLKYITRFYRYIWSERNNYDAVFVHMNQEYVLLGGIFWRALGKRVVMWRNHYAGSILTQIAGKLSHKALYTSVSSYTAKFKNGTKMPVGVDTERFGKDTGVVRTPNSILFLGRITPSKKPGILLEALGNLHKKGIEFTASFYGPAQDGYVKSLKDRAQELGIASFIHFGGSVPHKDLPEIYQEHEMYVNLADAGMYDKTLFEAAASGCKVLCVNKEAPFMHITTNPECVADSIEKSRGACVDHQALADAHALSKLIPGIRSQL